MWAPRPRSAWGDQAASLPSWLMVRSWLPGGPARIRCEPPPRCGDPRTQPQYYTTVELCSRLEHGHEHGGSPAPRGCAGPGDFSAATVRLAHLGAQAARRDDAMRWLTGSS